MSKHTPGPYHIDVSPGTYWDPKTRWCIKTETGAAVAESSQCSTSIYGKMVLGQADLANAHLFAAAPELLEALKTALNALELNHHLVTNEEQRMISVKGQVACMRAIAKAEGREK